MTALTIDRLDWWAHRIYDAIEFAAYTVDLPEGAMLRDHPEAYRHDDALADTLAALRAEAAAPEPRQERIVELDARATEGLRRFLAHPRGGFYPHDALAVEAVLGGGLLVRVR